MRRRLIALATASTVAAGAIVPAQAEETSSPTNYVTGSFTGSSDPSYNGTGSTGSSTLDLGLIALAAVIGTTLISSFLQGNAGPLPQQIQTILDQVKSSLSGS